MFEHFTFGAVSQTPDQEISSFSPKDTSFQITPKPSALEDISHADLNEPAIASIIDKFNEQSLSYDSPGARLPDWSCNFKADDDETMTESTYMTRHKRNAASLPTTPFNDGIACRRLQRQLNVQMQSSPTHIRDINVLVEDMISSHSQCRLNNFFSRRYSSPPPSHDSSLPESGLEVEATGYGGSDTDIDIDEGFHEEETAEAWEHELMWRRTSLSSGIRKSVGLRFPRSQDVVCMNGRIKVRCRPRMRKRRRIPTVKQS